MSANTFWLIVPADSRATVLQITGGEVTSFAAQRDDNTSLAKAVLALLREQNYDGEAVMLALRSEAVLSVPLPPDAAANRQTTIYELEDYLPIAAEQFTADFAVHPAARFAGAIHHSKFLPFLDELAEGHIFVQSIVPLAVLAAQYYINHSEQAGNALRCLLWNSFDCADRLDLFFLTADGQPLSWQLLDSQPDSLKRTLESEVLKQGTDIDAVGFDLLDELQQCLTDIPRIRFQNNTSENGFDTVLAYQSTAILTRKQKPWLEFCREQLAMRGTDKVLGKSIQFALWGAAVFLMVLCLVFFVRSLRYGALTAHYRQEQEKVFREALPQQNIQTGFRNRLESEYKKMSVLRDDTADLPQPESALIPLLKILQSLPPKVRYRFPEIRIESNNVRLDGQLQVHGDAEVIATALENGGFAVEPPGTQQSGNSGVSVRLSVVRKREEAKP